MKLTIKQGDITELDVDAIINPANSKGFMGGGVALAIKQKGGPEIENQALKEAPIKIGKAALTEAGKLKAKWIIHAPTMELPAQPTTFSNVKKSVLAALKLADKQELKTIAFPGMGTGVGKIRKAEAANIMISEIKKDPAKNIEEIFLVAYDNELFKEFNKAKDI